MGKHLTFTERLIIEKMFNSGATYRDIALRLSRAVSGIYREVQNGLYEHLDGQAWLYVRRYSATKAQDRAEYQYSAHGRSVKLGHNYTYADTVRSLIHSGYSPDAITGQLKRRGEWTVSTSTLYRYIDRGYIPGVTNHDLLEKPYRKRKYNKVRAAKRPPVGLSIEERPKSVLDRNDFGHWEMDCVIGKSVGKGQAILVLTERLTRFECIYKLTNKTSLAVYRRLNNLLSHSPSLFKSITCDNGSEFASACKLPIPVYYCHPYCSSERGSNENANRIIRRFFPKGSNFNKITQNDCDYVSRRINDMPRKILNYCTAAECFNEQVSRLELFS